MQGERTGFGAPLISLSPHRHSYIDYVDTKAKCRTCKGTLRQVFNCVRPHLYMTPYPPPLHKVIQYMQYNNPHIEGGGGELTREKVRGATVQKAGSKIPT